VAPLSVRASLFHSFEQDERVLGAQDWQALPWSAVRTRLMAHPTARDALGVKAESVIFEVGKFLGLCAGGNPNALEILFADERDWVFETPASRRIHAERRLFLTRKVQQTYLGYGLSQLKRIRTHRSWLLNPPAGKPSRADFGLPDGGTFSADDQHRIEQGVAEKLRSYGIDELELPKASRLLVAERLSVFWRDTLGVSEAELEERMRALATRALSLPPEVVTTLNAEKAYRAAMKHWESYQHWKLERNPARAELERRFGYDTKHAMHLVRLMRMGLEVVESGELRVRRADADELIAIRDGGLSYEALLEEAERLQERMRANAAATSLPPEVDFERVDALLMAVLAD
jgi:predicted nucleotidyltransferase